MVKIGIIGCLKYGDMCQAAKDLMKEKEETGIFRDIGSNEIIGLIPCGGCPGKQVIERAKLLNHCGADIIALYSCNSHACPHNTRILKELSKHLKSVIIIDHFGKGA